MAFLAGDAFAIAHASHDSHQTNIVMTFHSQEEELEVEEEGAAPSNNSLMNAEIERLRDALTAKDAVLKASQAKLMWAMHKRSAHKAGNETRFWDIITSMPSSFLCLCLTRIYRGRGLLLRSTEVHQSAATRGARRPPRFPRACNSLNKA